MGFDLGLVVAGLIGLLIGGEWLVRGAVGVAHRAGLSPMVIGLTLVGFGTSTPELLTSVQAALIGAPGIALGNVVGSNIANILLVLALAALIAPFPATFNRDLVVMGLVALACAGIFALGRVGWPAGMALVLALLVYLLVTLRSADANDVPDAETGPPMRPAVAIGLFVLGLALTLLGARALVLGGIGLAEALGVSQTVIGVTVVAVGTSLPELVTSVIAARKGQSGLALGNVIGSNIFNVLGILGVTALVTPIPVPPAMMGLHIWTMLAASAALIVLAASRGQVGRVAGAAGLAAYAVYIGLSVLGV